MAASQGFLINSKRVLDSENGLEKLNIQEKELCKNEDHAALREPIAKLEEDKLEAHYKRQDLLKRTAEDILRAIRSDAEDLMQQQLSLQNHYFALIDWMSRHWTTDADGNEISYFEEFQRDHPYYFLWLCN